MKTDMLKRNVYLVVSVVLALVSLILLTPSFTIVRSTVMTNQQTQRVVGGTCWHTTTPSCDVQGKDDCPLEPDANGNCGTGWYQNSEDRFSVQSGAEPGGVDKFELGDMSCYSKYDCEPFDSGENTFCGQGGFLENSSMFTEWMAIAPVCNVE